jgi:hypothetical protein
MFYRGLQGQAAPSIVKSLSKVYDGASSTILLSENIQAGNYVSGLDIVDDDDAAAKVEALTGIVWWHPAFLGSASDPNTASERSSMLVDNPMLQVNGAKLEGPSGGSFDVKYARPSSGHPGVVNAAMCGGEVITISEGVDYRVYQQLMTSLNKRNQSDMWKQTADAVDAALPLSDDDFK